MRVSPELLYAIAPGADGEIVDAIVAHQSVMVADGLTDPKDVAYFLGQCACETGGFTRLEENLYYTSTKRLRQVWPSRFKTDAAAAPYVRNPKLLANLVYGGRLGNVAANDGWDYRGSGDKQTTGKYNFSVVEKEAKIPCVANPEILRTHPGALKSATVYWRVHKLARFTETANIDGLTKAVQGGTGGLADRRRYTQRALAHISGRAPATAPQKAPRRDWIGKGLMNDPRVKHAQERLKLHGFYEGGTLDGDFGDGTDLAVREFQTAKGLISDGKIGDATLKALNAAPGIPAIPVGGAPASGNDGASAPKGLAGLIKALLEAIMRIFKRG